MPYNLQLLFSLTLRLHCQHTCIYYIWHSLHIYILQTLLLLTYMTRFSCHRSWHFRSGAHSTWIELWHDRIITLIVWMLPTRSRIASNRIESNRSEHIHIYMFACMQCAEGVSAIFGVTVGPWQEAEVLNLDCFMQRQRATPRLRMGGRLQNVQLTWHLSVDCFMFLVLL